jgi:hypothetical protein
MKALVKVNKRKIIFIYCKNQKISLRGVEVNDENIINKRNVKKGSKRRVCCTSI